MNAQKTEIIAHCWYLFRYCCIEKQPMTPSIPVSNHYLKSWQQLCPQQRLWLLDMLSVRC